MLVIAWIACSYSGYLCSACCGTCAGHKTVPWCSWARWIPNSVRPAGREARARLRITFIAKPSSAPDIPSSAWQVGGGKSNASLACYASQFGLNPCIWLTCCVLSWLMSGWSAETTLDRPCGAAPEGCAPAPHGGRPLAAWPCKIVQRMQTTSLLALLTLLTFLALLALLDCHIA